MQITSVSDCVLTMANAKVTVYSNNAKLYPYDPELLFPPLETQFRFIPLWSSRVTTSLQQQQLSWFKLELVGMEGVLHSHSIISFNFN